MWDFLSRQVGRRTSFLRTILMTCKEEVGIDVKGSQVEKLENQSGQGRNRSGIWHSCAMFKNRGYRDSARTFLYVPTSSCPPDRGCIPGEACLIEVVEVFVSGCHSRDAFPKTFVKLYLLFYMWVGGAYGRRGLGSHCISEGLSARPRSGKHSRVKEYHNEDTTRQRRM